MESTRVCVVLVMMFIYNYDKYKILHIKPITASKGDSSYHIEDPNIEIVTFLPNVLEITSILHVTLLVFLRLIAITEPIKYKEIHIKIRHTSIITIWLMSFGVRIIAILSQKYKPSVFFYYRYFALHIFHTLPVICIIAMYVILMKTLRRRNGHLEIMVDNSRHLADSMNRRMTIVVQRIVLALLICYVPFLVWEQYYMIISERNPFIIYTSEVIIYWKLSLVMIYRILKIWK